MNQSPQWWGLWQVDRARMRGDPSTFSFLRKVARPRHLLLPPRSLLGARAISVYLVSGWSSPRWLTNQPRKPERKERTEARRGELLISKPFPMTFSIF